MSLGNTDCWATSPEFLIQPGNLHFNMFSGDVDADNPETLENNLALFSSVEP